MIDLRELDNLDLPDIEVAAPEDYVSGNAPNLIPEGRYTFNLVDFDFSRDRDTKQPDGKAFVITLEVVGGPHEGRRIFGLRVWTARYERKGVMVSGVGDLVRAIDKTRTWKTHADVGAILQEAIDKKLPIQARVVWGAFDQDWYLDQGGGNLESKSREAKDLRKKASIKGMKHFRQAPDGSFLPEVEGPSGNMLEARLEIASFVDSDKQR